MKRSELRNIIKEEIKENMGYWRKYKDPSHGLETRNKTAQKLIKDYGWEIADLMDELENVGSKVENWVEQNKDKSLGPAAAAFSRVRDSLKQLKKIIK